MKTILLFFGILFLNFSCSEKIDSNKFSLETDSNKIFLENQDRESSISKLQKALKNNRTVPESEIDYTAKPISDSKSAVNIAEKILFKEYGKDEIIEQRPYNVVFQNGYWILNGTRQEPMIGGEFLIIMNSKDGKIIELIHGE